ncbi:hypothetical protein DL991_10740 [Amycolatopsis sp. WAC 01375]|uniref:alpha/beta fold hydrolase n=1 Tax=Amycolatopsis sp. WAC 01375 TaxID=2203194 RepID=UPI000F7B16DF|nr:alpha/beta hydrolase [Amycolatopsis sp. WAC 01375]RSM80579.1 hypothetical protein DL991_10740 [Amycolatopsis sp. WAC 01375]
MTSKEDMHAFQLDITDLTTTSADGTPIRITRIGRGPDVILVHGGMDDTSSWVPVATVLGRHHRCWLVHRRRADTGDDYSLDREVDDLSAVLERIGGPASVVGHSYGALIALHALLRMPALPVMAAILYEPPLIAEGPVVRGLLDPITTATERGDYAAALHSYLREFAGLTPTLAVEKSRDTWLQSQIPALLREVEMADRLKWTAETYTGITVPTLLLLGDRSAEHSNRDSTLALAKTLPAARLVGMPRHGHLAHRRDPAYVAALIRTYLADPAHTDLQAAK